MAYFSYLARRRYVLIPPKTQLGELNRRINIPKRWRRENFLLEDTSSVRYDMASVQFFFSPGNGSGSMTHFWRCSKGAQSSVNFLSLGRFFVFRETKMSIMFPSLSFFHSVVSKVCMKCLPVAGQNRSDMDFDFGFLVYRFFVLIFLKNFGLHVNPFVNP